MKQLSGEAKVKRDVMELLTKLGIRHFRMNSGSPVRRMKGHKAGTADILAAPCPTVLAGYRPIYLWLECKDPDGKTAKEQLEAQAAFAKAARANGEIYARVESVADVIAVLQSLGCIGSSEDNPVPTRRFDEVEAAF